MILTVLLGFDRVSHHKLIIKISNMGIQGNNLLWISDFCHTDGIE